MRDPALACPHVEELSQLLKHQQPGMAYMTTWVTIGVVDPGGIQADKYDGN